MEDGNKGQTVLRDLRLLDIPPADASHTATVKESDTPEAALARLQAMQGGRLPGHSDEIPQRKLPWIIDIFLYPLNRAGLSILLISVGIPFAMRVVVAFFFFLMGAFPPALILWVLAIILRWAALAIFLLYMNWYLCECIRDSAAGGIRAVDTTAATPGLAEILGQMLKVIAGIAVAMAPAIIYVRHTASADALFWTLYGAGGFLMPMALLGVVMYDSLRGLNPILLIGSILRTFLYYCALVAFCYPVCLLVATTVRHMRHQWIVGFGLLFLAFYQLLILAHLLGRFYRRNEERLGWDA
jgi:hypothetical protein